MYDPRVIRRIVPRRRVMDWITRLGDLALAAALLATTLPLMVIVALAIKVGEPGTRIVQAAVHRRWPSVLCV